MITRENAPNMANVVGAPKLLMRKPPMSSPDPCPKPQWTPCKIPENRQIRLKNINFIIPIFSFIQNISLCLHQSANFSKLEGTD